MSAPSSVRFLFVDHGLVRKPQLLREHRHPFWQLEVFTAGICRARCAHSGLALQAGDLLLIPAGVAHAFDYHQAGCAWLSVKFALVGRLPAQAGRLQGDGSAALAAALNALLADVRQPSPPLAEAAGHLIAALLGLAGHATGGSAHPASLVERATALVEASDGQRWTVAALAQRLGVGPGHLSTRFQIERGQTLKSFIDHQRATCAEALLADRGMPMAQIADLLDFSDVFSFSRFFKRIRGQAPSIWRRQLPGSCDSAMDTSDSAMF